MLLGLLSGRAGPLCMAALHALALAIFVHGFLLTRVRLDQRSTALALLPAPRPKLVWLLIDSLRYDFVVSDGRYSCRPGALCHQGRMPFLGNLTRKAEVARGFRFIADPPTTTTQRLKSLMTGGLPSFFDVSSSFTAGQVSEDNLIDQLVDAGRRLVFMGDATWSNLFPTQFSSGSFPFPCFNVKDLHTVDDGVWGLLPPALEAAGGWDVLIAHYLGVDHAGHAHGVDSQDMADKLAQMDSHIRQVAEAMARGAGPGGEYERALLLVSGDHGQTLNGDHGGGSPEEVDSVLVAINPSALWRHLSPSGHYSVSDFGVGRSSSSSSSDSGAGSQAGQGSILHPGSLCGPAPCRTTCSCGPDGNQCAADLPQADLTPTLAALLGVPIPFGNVGKVSPELWGFAVAHPCKDGDGSKDWGEGGGPVYGSEAEASLAAVLQANVEQVHTYLNTYAATPGASLSGAALRGINSLFDSLAAGADNSTHKEADFSLRCLEFLEAAAGLAREQWTQFGDTSMLAGLALFAAALLLHAKVAFGGLQNPAPSFSAASKAAAVSPDNGQHRAGDACVKASLASRVVARLVQAGLLRWAAHHSRWPAPTMAAAFTALVAVHVLGIFSFFFLLSEGSKLCYALGVMFALLAASTALRPLCQPLQRPALAPSSQQRGPTCEGTLKTSKPAAAVRGLLALQALFLGAVLVGSTAGLACWGLASHSGLAFWHRLTVHPTEAAEHPTEHPTEQAEVAVGEATAGASAAAGRLGAQALGALQAWLLSLTQGEGFWGGPAAGAGSAMLCLLPIACLAAAALGMQSGFALPAGGCSLAGLRLQRLLLGAAFASVAAHHWLEQCLQQDNLEKDVTVTQLLQHWQLGNWVGFAWARQLYMAVATLGSPLGLEQIRSCQLLQHMPLRLLLPRLTYALCTASLVLWALQQAQRQLQRQVSPPAAHPISAASHGGDMGLARMAQRAVGLQGPLLAALLQVSDPKAPWLLLLGAAQLWAAVQLLRLRALHSAHSADAGAAPAGTMLEAGALLGVMQAQAFFTTGHLCEFAGLQYLAGFVGYDEFHLLRSATLLVIHTFGAMVLVVLALPATLSTLEAATAIPYPPKAGSGANVSQDPAAEGGGSPVCRRGLLAFLFVRACTAFAATLSAAVQRRHLYAWSLFAPKFAFELVWLLGTDALVSFLCLLI